MNRMWTAIEKKIMTTSSGRFKLRDCCDQRRIVLAKLFKDKKDVKTKGVNGCESAVCGCVGWLRVN
jgi:hypothetical protein